MMSIISIYFRFMISKLKLLGDDTYFQQENDISSFIAEISECLAETDGCISNVGFDDWCKWANTQVDRIDPVCFNLVGRG